MRTLYIDCFSGISGDMLLGALIDCGADIEKLKMQLAKLGLSHEFKLHIKKVNKKGIVATKCNVLLSQSEAVKETVLQPANHVNSDTTHEHIHHQLEHHHTHHSHEHRSYSSIVKLIKEAELGADIEETAISIFRKIGEAEARIHGVPVEDVHFHEVGAVDSIVDIVGISILLHDINVERIYSSSVPVGSGKIHIDHGIYPVPAPATLELLVGIPITESNVKGELTTPTGAGVLAAVCNHFGPIPSMTIKSVGYGAGTKDFPNHPNVLRVILGE
ncbi:LarC family nickel insertion protein [Bacillus pinisoli]|uniref:LarC family nickel insertion protein n=1 Tax=Bacillus pinisoli TaxID=2901866 RepID=UPI001FF324DB|nr:LarC family nickel insertion protein [Bacillus pinisoli]